MAIYEYQCNKEDCGVVQELYAAMSAVKPETLSCPKCGGPSAMKVSAPAVLTGSMTNAPLDVVIGQDAAKRWDRIHERQEKRDKIRRESGKPGLTAVGVNEYVPTDKPLRAVATPEPKDD
jgi:putative FmdB family regulatory protein